MIKKLKKRQKISESIFLAAGSKLINADAIFNDLYNKFKNEDGFLYIEVSTISTFG